MLQYLEVMVLIDMVRIVKHLQIKKPTHWANQEKRTTQFRSTLARGPAKVPALAAYDEECSRLFHPKLQVQKALQNLKI